MIVDKKFKYFYFFFGMVALIAGIINGLANPFYPCAVTLIPASFLYFIGILHNREIWEKKSIQFLLLTVGLSLVYAGIWELLILTGWNDFLHIFMLLTGIYFCTAIKFSKTSLIIGLSGGIIFITFIRMAYLFGLFNLNIQLKIPFFQEIGSWFLAIAITGILISIVIYRSKFFQVELIK
ncbi:MAG: hypothetical protein ACTSQJ_01660 [Promethearchaeota archaeon]